MSLSLGRLRITDRGQVAGVTERGCWRSMS